MEAGNAPGSDRSAHTGVAVLKPAMLTVTITAGGQAGDREPGSPLHTPLSKSVSISHRHSQPGLLCVKGWGRFSFPVSTVRLFLALLVLFLAIPRKGEVEGDKTNEVTFPPGGVPGLPGNCDGLGTEGTHLIST